MRRLLRLGAQWLMDWLDRTEPVRCTGVSASWCPVCGDCSCKEPEESRSDDDCPLHGMTSRHAENEGGDA